VRQFTQYCLLIRTAGGRWIANGVVRVLEDEDEEE
jgi:hypothetical protein